MNHNVNKDLLTENVLLAEECYEMGELKSQVSTAYVVGKASICPSFSWKSLMDSEFILRQLHLQELYSRRM